MDGVLHYAITLKEDGKVSLELKWYSNIQDVLMLSFHDGILLWSIGTAFAMDDAFLVKEFCHVKL